MRTRLGPDPARRHIWWLLTRRRIVRMEMPGRPLNGQPMSCYRDRATHRAWLAGRDVA